MHEPLPRNTRLREDQNSTLALARACAFVVILAVALVGIAVIAGELGASTSDQAVATVKLTTGSSGRARDAAPSSSDLFSGMPLP
jgi:hypothetical protein